MNLKLNKGELAYLHNFLSEQAELLESSMLGFEENSEGMTEEENHQLKQCLLEQSIVWNLLDKLEGV